MKKFFSVPAMIAVALCLSFSSCGDKGQDNNKEDIKEKISEVIAKADSALPNYRYVDLDSVLSSYNLAKDYNEEILRMQNNMQSEAKKRENSLQSKATTMQTKMQNNGYLSQASYDADQKELVDLQNKAQKDLANMQSKFEATAMMAQKTVNDSIVAYINEYNKQKGYDAIFFKAATLYINPALDITDEVIKGLNARYNNKAK